MIHEWKPSDKIRNLGDAFTELLADVMLFATKEEMENDPEYKYFLIGSVIDNDIIMNTLRDGYKPVFVNCGWRGNPLSKVLLDQCRFIGCRGPITKNVLAEAGIDVEVTLDSAYLLKDLVQEPIKKTNKVLVFPHLLSSESADSLTVVYSKSSILKRMRQIAESGFVLGGAMHSCIVAHIYGVPFSPYVANDFYVDAPTKWKDWLESIGIPQENLRFARTYEEGRAWYDANKHYLVKEESLNPNLS
jgi:hypothetical protein